MHVAFAPAILSNTWLIAAIWMALALVGALLAIRFSISAALIEILLGVIAGNVISLRSNTWLDFVAGFGSIMLTFLAGAEINPAVIREQWKPAAAIGVCSFFAPFLAAMIYARYIAHWSPDAAKVAGIAMSTTSVAVVYAVMVESGLAKKAYGQLISAACFITDLGTVVALGLLFANFNAWLALFATATLIAALLAPRFLPAVFMSLGDRVSEPGARCYLRSYSGRAVLQRLQGAKVCCRHTCWGSRVLDSCSHIKSLPNVCA